MPTIHVMTAFNHVLQNIVTPTAVHVVPCGIVVVSILHRLHVHLEQNIQADSICGLIPHGAHMEVVEVVVDICSGVQVVVVRLEM